MHQIMCEWKGGTDYQTRSGWHQHINTISITVVSDDDIKRIGLIHSVRFFL